MHTVFCTRSRVLVAMLLTLAFVWACAVTDVTAHDGTRTASQAANNALDVSPSFSHADSGENAGTDRVATPASVWRELEPGLQFIEIRDRQFNLTALRIDPDLFDFVLCAAGRSDGKQRTLREWSEQENLTAAINASMYLPDGLTSTGYMREGDYTNNPKLVQRFGAFLVAGPDDPDLAQARILEKDEDIWEELLPHYRLVVQNYRIINSQRRILWAPGGPLYSISAVASDGTGHILFLHSRDPIEAYTFAQRLLHLPLDVRTVLYAEGGGQAGLVVRSAALVHEVQGSSALNLLITGNRLTRVPNVLGIRHKSEAGKVGK